MVGAKSSARLRTRSCTAALWSKPAVISALGLGLLYPSHPTLAARVSTSPLCHDRTDAVQRNDARRRAIDGPRARCMFHCGHAPAAPLGMVLCIGGCSPARALVSLTATRLLVRS